MKVLEQFAVTRDEVLIGSPERISYDVLYDQKKLIDDNTLIRNFLDSVPVFICILNSYRQIVFTNKNFQEYLNKTTDDVLGKRPGEAVNCIHSSTGRGGCGTSDFCRNCGALHAILGSYKGNRTVEECRISVKKNQSLDLLVWATPIHMGGHDLTIFTMSDISSDNRRKALERIFFHDILNTAGGLRGFIDLLKVAEQSEMNEYLDISESLIEKLIDEIKAQRTISEAENGELKLDITPFSSREILEEVKLLYLNHDVAIGKQIEVRKGSADIIVQTDKTILRRIIVNLTKNALEASKVGDIVFLSCRIVEGLIEFQVENPSFIPENVQMQLFQRSFSTKGYGRGLGTYSVKMLSENYLKGEVNFISTESEGTIFRARYPKVIEG